MLVRHAVAVARRKWDGPDDLRPLTKRGRRQAEGLVELLSPFGAQTVLSSPNLRCTATVQPLARHCGLAVEGREELCEGEDESAAALVYEAPGEAVVVCTHGDVIPEVLSAVAERDGVALGPEPRWAKGSVWVLYGQDGRFHRASYLAPPA